MGRGNIAVRQWLEDKRRFADLFNGVVFDGEQVIRPEELEICDSESDVIVTDKNGKKKGSQRYRDVVMRWKKDTELAILACENQKKVHYAMPVRTMLYDSLSYIDQINQLWKEKSEQKENVQISEEEYLSHFRKDDRIYPVLTLVFYYGEKKWDAEKDLYGMFKLGEKDKRIPEKYIPNYHINLIAPENIEELEKFKTDLQVIFGMLKCKGQKKDLLEYVKKHKGYFTNVDRGTYLALEELLHSERLLNKVMPEMEDGKESVNMCQALEELYADGIAEGKRVGMSEGERIGRTEGERIGRTEGERIGRTEGERTKTWIIVRNMLSRGMSEQDICALAECTPEFVAEVRGM